MTSCPNCLNQFSGNYCNNCGQKKIVGRLSSKIVFTDFVQDVFLFDSKLFKTIIDLILKPAKLVKSYLKGKHKSFFPPFKLFLFSSTAYLIVFHFFGDDMLNYRANLYDGGTEALDDDLQITTLIKKNLNIGYFLLVPILSFFISKFYRSLNYNFAEAFIFTLYIIGISLLLSSIFITLGQITPVFYTVLTVIQLSYILFAIVQFTNSKSLWGIIKTLLIMVLSYATLVIISSILVGVYFIYFVDN